MARFDLIQIRGDTAANWTVINPVLAAREQGMETDTRKFKLGDGTTAWNSLTYWDCTGLSADALAASAAATNAAASAAASSAYGEARSPNLFVAADVISGQECYGDGTLQPQANSYASANMYVYGAKAVAISGLGANVGFARYVHFLASNGTTLVQVTTIADGKNAGLFAIPAGTYYMRFSPRQRIAGSSDFSAVKVVISNSIYTGRVVALFGDSITETENVDAGTYTYGSGYRANWPDYVVPRILPLTVHNFAKSGAHYADATGLTSNQKFSQQVTNAQSTGAAFDTIIVGLGTNDWGNSTTSGGGSVVLGTAAAALAKDYGSLSLSISMDGMRQGLQRLRNSFPTATIFVLTPIQRGDFTYTAMSAWVDDIKVMAAAFGAEVIDQFSESGIVYFFETVSGSGVDLLDLIHPRTSGMEKQAELISARLQRRLGGGT